MANSGKWILAWTVAYAANLIIPLYFGLLVCGKTESWLGMAMGVLVWWALPAPICFWSGRIRVALVIGAGFVAITQFIPMIHLIAGIVAIDLWQRFSETDQLNSFTAGFSITMMTGLFEFAIVLLTATFFYTTGRQDTD